MSTRDGPHKQSLRPTNDHQRALSATRVSVNKMIRERDLGFLSISCGKTSTLEAGHFRASTHGTIRVHHYDLNGQCATCNRYSGGVTYEYSLAFDEKFGTGTAMLLKKLSDTIEPWDMIELEQLRSAARMGMECLSTALFFPETAP
jgi:hypothetical protein